VNIPTLIDSELAIAHNKVMIIDDPTMGYTIKIVDARTGGSPSLGQFIGRYLAYILYGVVLGLAFIWAAFDDRKQGWHDKPAIPGASPGSGHLKSLWSDRA
jgi:hypothetical protein